MKRTHRGKLAGSWIAGLLLAFAGVSAHAANTAAGTNITNTATVNYKVNDIPQTQKDDSIDFLVDAKLSLTVVRQDGAVVSTTPGSTTAVTEFLVTNDGNTAETIYPAFVNLATGQDTGFGSNSDFQVTSAIVYLDDGDHVFNSTSDTVVAANAKAGADVVAGGTQTFWVVSTIPASATDGQLAAVGLEAAVGKPGATAALGVGNDDTANAWTPGTVQYLFAEAASPMAAGTNDSGAYDGVASDHDGYKIAAAKLTVAKTSAIVTDPINCTTAGNPATCGAGELHALPGSVMEYTIKASNATGGQTATDVTISDNLTAMDAYISFNANSMKVTPPGGSEAACTDGADTDKCAYDTGTKTVSAGTFSLSAGQDATVKFQVTIQ